MIICRSPLRISLGGGGTDIPSYYEKYEGRVISAAINKYVFTTIIVPYVDGIFLKYSNSENVEKIKDIKHPIIREVLKNYKNISKRIEITTLADIPSGTGLGSSGSFTNSLIKALQELQHKKVSNRNLAEESCKIEIDNLKRPVGKQDQYISSFGGLKNFKFKKNGKVLVENINIKKKTIIKLEDNLLLFFTGFTRSSSKILGKQDNQTKNSQKKIIDNLHEVKKIGEETSKLFEKGNLYDFGELLNYHWKKKLERSKEISNEKINFMYNEALKNGAIGGKLVGAGGGGFLMFYTEDKEKLRNKMRKLKINELNFDFDYEGTKIL
jgi:D-glycero-alpha-D-manno-heptose-7-phosphate kinase